MRRLRRPAPRAPRGTGASSTRTPLGCSDRLPSICTAVGSPGRSTRSATVRRPGRPSMLRRSPAPRSKSTRQMLRPRSARAAASDRCTASVVVPTPPLLPASASIVPTPCPPSSRTGRSLTSLGRTVWAHEPATRTADSTSGRISGSPATPRNPACSAAASSDRDCSWVSRTSPMWGADADSFLASSNAETCANCSCSSTTSTSADTTRPIRPVGVVTTSVTTMSAEVMASAFSWEAAWLSSAASTVR